jgi:ABC-type glycerol-3-phosphate transport system permease component
MNYLLALTVNLTGTLLIYSLMAYSLVRLHWHHRGTIAVLTMIIFAGFFWYVPTILAFVLDSRSADPVSYSLWFGNWLVSGFSVAILCLAVKGIPRQLEDSARLDGCGWFGIYWHLLLPSVRRELGLIAFLTLMATGGLCWGALSIRGGFKQLSPPWMSWLPWPSSHPEPNPTLAVLLVVEMIALCVAVTVPVMAIFFYSKHYLRQPMTPNNT